MPTLQDILAAPKTVNWPAKGKIKSPPTQVDADLELSCGVSGMRGQLVLYVRVNTILPESFSIGLRLEPQGKKPSLLVRLNGWHGPHPNPDGTIIPGHTAHIHLPTAKELAGDYTGKVELRTAVELQPLVGLVLPSPPDVVSVWPFFQQYLNIAPDPRVTTLLSELCDSTSQQSLEDALNGC